LLDIGIRLQSRVAVLTGASVQVTGPQTTKPLIVTQVIEHLTVMAKAKGAHSLQPGWLPQISLIVQEDVGGVGVQIVQVQILSARGIANIRQIASVRREGGLKHTHTVTSSQSAGLNNL
jgi:hypothetical protein